jgi:mRNA-degrading endonuclease toxin of MazEF toxin-antitoxin module
MVRQGDVVLVTLFDPRGQNPKLRPAVVLTADHEIAADGQIVLAAISTQFDPAKLPKFLVPVPSDPQGHPQTGLRRKSVVKCNWLKAVRCDEVTAIGRLPHEYLQSVLRQIAKLPRD